MPIDRRPDPSSLRPAVKRIQTTSGPKPVSLSDHLAYVADQVAAGDRARQIGSPNPINFYAEPLASESWPDDSPGLITLHPRDAAMLAVSTLLASIKWNSRELGELVADPRKTPVITQHKLAKVRLEWPDWDGPDIPVDSALVNAGGEAQWDPARRQAYLIDGTEGVYGEGTILRYLGEYQVPISVFAWFAHRDIRRGFEARFCAMLAANRVDDVFCRRVLVPAYFDQEARIQLGGSSRPDDAASAASNRWPLEVQMSVEVAQVELIRTPARTKSVATNVRINELG